jgi:glycosyltransferase involved in cell wall biosynthesis
MNSLIAEARRNAATREPVSGRPAVSVIVANYNGAAYLTDAIASVQRQTLHNIEIIVADDGSTDDSVALVRRLMDADARIRLLQDRQNRGPGAARNRALAVAEGEWIAVMDSDDLMHPERLSRLVEAAGSDGAELAADNILEFFQNAATLPRPLLSGRWASGPRWIDVVEYVRGNLFYVSEPSLGYLKPLFKASTLKDYRYDEILKVGEDYDLVVRLLHSGKKLRVYPEPLYFYRKHDASLSHRADKNVLRAMQAANRRFLDQVSPSDFKVIAAVKTRMRSLDTALLFDELLDALKAGHWPKALRIALKRPRVVALLRFPIGTRLRRLIALLPGCGNTCFHAGKRSRAAQV